MSNKDFTPETWIVRLSYAEQLCSDIEISWEDALAAFDRWFDGYANALASESLIGYAEALEENRSAEDWDKEEFVEDIRQWARDVWG